LDFEARWGEVDIKPVCTYMILHVSCGLLGLWGPLGLHLLYSSVAEEDIERRRLESLTKIESLDLSSSILEEDFYFLWEAACGLRRMGGVSSSQRWYFAVCLHDASRCLALGRLALQTGNYLNKSEYHCAHQSPFPIYPAC
jgi:hypothetical protein